MAKPHPALIELAAGRSMPPVSDPNLLLDSAVEHRMHGLLWRWVEAGELTGDAEWQTSLAMRSLHSERHHRHLWKSLADITHRLDAVNVEVATFKGVTAEARWYDRIGDRPCRDADILVDPGMQHRANEILALLVPEHPLVGKLQELVASGLLQAVELMVDGVNIDLHFDLFKLGIPSETTQMMWDRTEELLAPSGQPIRVLDAESSLVHFALHTNRDRLRQLIGFADVARIVSQENLDWQTVRTLAAADGLEVPISKTIIAVLSTLNLPPPPLVPPTGWRSQVWDSLWNPEVCLQGSSGAGRFGRRGYLGLPLLARGRTLEALAWMGRRLFPPTSYLDYFHPETHGPYLWRAIASRLEQLERNRKQRSVAHPRP